MRPTRIVSVIIYCEVLFSPLYSLGQRNGNTDCLAYEPAVVTLRGILTRHTFPGPPNYENIRNGDRPETALIMDLRSPVCVNEDPAQPDLNPAKQQIRHIQLVLKTSEYEQYKTLVGRRVTATGTLSGKLTGHHHTPVLLTVRTLEVGQPDH